MSIFVCRVDMNNQWVVVEVGDESGVVQSVHVLPIEDMREHELSECWCNPRDDDSVIVHNSHDGRELYEDGIRLFN